MPSAEHRRDATLGFGSLANSARIPVLDNSGNSLLPSKPRFGSAGQAKSFCCPEIAKLAV